MSVHRVGPWPHDGATGEELTGVAPVIPQPTGYTDDPDGAVRFPGEKADRTGA